MIYAVISQIIMVMTNLAILINNKLSLDFYKIYYISIPVIFYCVFSCIFYVKQLLNRRRHSVVVIDNVISMAALCVNLLYFIVEVFFEDPNNTFLYYILTTVVQLINVLYLFIYTKRIVPRIMSQSEAITHNILTYCSIILAIFTLYGCVFLDVYITIICLLITAILTTISSVMFSIAYGSQRRRR